jgi:MinD superfamily P-loop ATPase
MKKPIRIAIASGKGGTGKTTLATHLAFALEKSGMPVAYVDCDVEEPNGHIFLKPTLTQERDVTIPVPEVDSSRCTLCGACGKACRFSAILVLPTQVLTFPRLCHGCGGCLLACTIGAIREVGKVTGRVEQGKSGHQHFLQGRLNVGEAMAPPVIRAVLERTPEEATIIIDAPPGTSCPVIESVKTADVVVLVTEPTPFGLNDLKLAVAMVRALGLPFGVVVNRVGTGDQAVFEYCASEGIPVLLEIPSDRGIAQSYSRGEMGIATNPEFVARFLGLYERIWALSQPGLPKPLKQETVDRAEAIDGSPDSERPAVEVVPFGRTHEVPELVVISGKGGTGKTSVVASFFAFATHAAVADCDVDAADLHLLLTPTIRQRHAFSGGKKAVIDAKTCTGCGQCIHLCRYHAIVPSLGVAGSPLVIQAISCEGCGICVDHCPEHAISFRSSRTGEWFISHTRHGPMVHARLGIAEENSGKLVSLVRKEAKAVAAAQGCNLLICDGSPGIGCPVIASITGATMVLAVTEPTQSGLHDLDRVLELCRQFKVQAGICINKFDINPDMATTIESYAELQAIPVLGKIRYDDSVTVAQIKQRAVVELGEGPAAADMRALWQNVQHRLHTK